MRSHPMSKAVCIERHALLRVAGASVATATTTTTCPQQDKYQRHGVALLSAHLAADGLERCLAVVRCALGLLGDVLRPGGGGAQDAPASVLGLHHVTLRQLGGWAAGRPGGWVGAPRHHRGCKQVCTFLGMGGGGDRAGGRGRQRRARHQVRTATALLFGGLGCVGLPL